MQTQLITPDSREWPSCLDRLQHDIYHKSEYVELCAVHEGGQPVAFLASEGESLLFVPLLLRTIPVADGYFDAASPYGYPSPLVKTKDTSFVSRAIEQMMSSLRQAGVVSVFVRFHPLLDSDVKSFEKVGRLVKHGETVYYDLTRSEDELWREVRRSARCQIKQLTKLGYTAEEDQQWQYLDDFIEAYWENMQRAKATEAYFFPAEYFYELKDSLRGSVHLIIVRAGDGRIAGGGVQTEVGGIVQAHLAGIKSEFAEHQPLKIMIDGVHRWAAERGNRYYHLGGGLGGKQDSLFVFKSGFAKGRADFFTWRAVVDDEVYHSLVSKWAERSGFEPDGLKGYFPAYRRAVPKKVSRV
ncbi:MAG: GNAT family N-acetyltransferase [Planctomycetales bacterium]|nr:GNAT family N-acetyltransferase [Planctomycetales bacterium]